MPRRALLLCLLASAVGAEPPSCAADLECAECVPDNMPLVAAGASGEQLTLECRGGGFVAYPLRAALVVACEAGRYRVRHDNTLRHLLELGCQEDVFEDVQHQVEDCDPPLQGRAYRLQEARGHTHLAALCFDQDRGVAVRARATNAPGNALPLPPHAEGAAPRSLLGNFNQMFDAATRHAAQRLYADDQRMTRRLRELLKFERVALGEQSLTAAPLLSALYFDGQGARVADFASNRVPAWRGVARGNLLHLQRDVARLMRAARPRRVLDVHAGAHGVLGLPAGRAGIYLQHERFPVPKYIWTVVHDKGGGRALAVAVLNDPFVALSEARAAAPCESVCARVAWLRELRRHRRHERPLYGLAFCCTLRELAAAVGTLPAALLANVTDGSAGLLAELAEEAAAVASAPPPRQ